MSSALDTLAAAARQQHLQVQAGKAQAYIKGYRDGALRAAALGLAAGWASMGLLAWLVYLVATTAAKPPC